MTDSTTENFLQVMSTFEWPEPEPLIYRLYYNEDGTPKCYAMENLPGKYIEVDRDTYVLSIWNVKVVDNKLQILKPVITVQKLQTNVTNGTPCHVADVCVIVGIDQPHTKWNIVINETN